ncbi:MAG TPA: hypothetical protein VK656_01650, partial [Candidatus Acidoferrum sp.]|nr:hypothetical protein [Candidatus Acidoferrum sp.]
MADARDDRGRRPPFGRDGGHVPRVPPIVRAGLAIVALAVAVYVVGVLVLPVGHSPAATATSPAAPTLAAVPSPGPSARASTAGPSSGTPGPTPSPLPSPTSPASPAGPRVPQWLAAVDADGALTTMDDHGGSVATYGAPGITFGFPAWSPDGTRIAAVGYGTSDTSIYVFTARRSEGNGGPAPVVIYRSLDSPPFYLFWEPDGKKVAFLATEQTGISLRLAPADGSAPLDGSGPGSVIRRGAPLYYDWTNAHGLVLHVGLGASGFLGEVGLDGSSAAPELPGTGNFRAPSVSRDGRYIAYATTDAATKDRIVVAARDGSSAHDLTVYGPAAFAFDPEGSSLATIGADAPVTGQPGFPVGPLRLLDAASGSVRTLLDGSVIGFFWSPDGRTIATLSLLPSGPTAGGATLARAEVAASSTPPGSPTALAFVDVATGSIRSQRVVGLGDHFVGQLLPYFDQYDLSHRFWSADSAALLLPLVAADGSP